MAQCSLLSFLVSWLLGESPFSANSAFLVRLVCLFPFSLSFCTISATHLEGSVSGCLRAGLLHSSQSKHCFLTHLPRPPHWVGSLPLSPATWIFFITRLSQAILLNPSTKSWGKHCQKLKWGRKMEEEEGIGQPWETYFFGQW